MPDPAGTPPYMRVRAVVSVGLSCGCAWPARKEPILAREAIWPGRVVLCGVHDDYAVINRVTSRLAATRAELIELLTAEDIDRITAEALVSEQFPDLPD